MEKYFNSCFIDEEDRNVFGEKIAILIYDGGLDELSAASKALKEANIFNFNRISKKLDDIYSKLLGGKEPNVFFSEQFFKKYKKI